MALTQAQWFEKLKSMVPAWVFEEQKYSVAAFQALAKVFAALDEDVDDQADATYILKAQAPVLDAHGDERGIPRLTDELNSVYAKRVQRITSLTDKISIKAAVDALLIIGECTILESPLDAPYCSRGSFCSRDSFMLGFFSDEFLVVIPPQTHVPYSFAHRSAYVSRSTFAGTTDQVTSLWASIIATIDRIKAFGVLYGVVESAS